jgi:hypothetical protein
MKHPDRSGHNLPNVVRSSFSGFGLRLRDVEFEPSSYRVARVLARVLTDRWAPLQL